MFPIPWLATLLYLKEFILLSCKYLWPKQKEKVNYLFIYFVIQAMFMPQIPQDSALSCLKAFLWLLKWLL